MNDTTVSALLPVHAGADPDHLAEAVESILAQSRPADEIVVVEDGPLTERHLRVLDALQRVHPKVVRVRLDHNQGAGAANQAGLIAATSVWIAKVDSDDISVADRFQQQLAHLYRTRADVCGSAMLEFSVTPEQPQVLRTAPLSSDLILRRLRSNSPINHPTAMYRRDLALQCGGYADMRYMQDYVLFARMAVRGAALTNVEEPLVHFRAGHQLHMRRSGLKFLRLEWQLQEELRCLGIIGPLRALGNYVVRMTYRLLPLRVAVWVHQNVLARRVLGQGVA